MRSPGVRIVLRRSDLSVVIAGYLPSLDFHGK